MKPTATYFSAAAGLHLVVKYAAHQVHESPALPDVAAVNEYWSRFSDAWRETWYQLDRCSLPPALLLMSAQLAGCSDSYRAGVEACVSYNEAHAASVHA